MLHPFSFDNRSRFQPVLLSIDSDIETGLQLYYMVRVKLNRAWELLRGLIKMGFSPYLNQ